MKNQTKKILILLAVAGCMHLAQAQQEPSNNAAGMRFGAANGFGYEFSYQRLQSSHTRLEFTAGYIAAKSHNRIRFTTAYQLVLPLDFLKEPGFFFFAGLGASAGHHRWKDEAFGTRNGVFVNGLAQMGVEHHFEFPIQISLDWRPEFGVINSNSGSDWVQFYLAFRYKF